MATISTYLFERIREVGVECTFGIPGDFVLPLYAAQEAVGMRTVVCTHEPGAAFAADAYARHKGLGVVLATYGAGALNLVNPVAMSFAEYVPVLVVSGAPETFKRGTDRRGSTYFHHVVRNLDSQLRVFREISAEQAVLNDPKTAGKKIDSVLFKMFLRSRPGYIEIPRDMTNHVIPDPDRPLHETFPKFDISSHAMKAAVDEIVSRLLKAKRPVLWVGVLSLRYHLVPVIIEIAERLGIPVVSSVMGKTAFPEFHPLFRGTYMAGLGNPEAQRALEEADFALAIGVIPSDSNFGMVPDLNVSPQRLINLNQRDIMAGHHRYDNLPLVDVVPEIRAEVFARVKGPAAKYKIPAPTPESYVPPRTTTPLTLKEIIAALKTLNPGDFSFISDIGESWFVGLELKSLNFICCADYCTMGYAVPAAIGSGIADKKRPFVIVGDGAFQMTGTEMATLLEQMVPAVVLLLNNAHYNMLGAFDGEREYFERRTWDYSAFAESMGCRAVKVTNAAELADALDDAVKSRAPILIEAIIDRNDSTPILTKVKSRLKGARLSDMFGPAGAVTPPPPSKTAMVSNGNIPPAARKAKVRPAKPAKPARTPAQGRGRSVSRPARKAKKTVRAKPAGKRRPSVKLKTKARASRKSGRTRTARKRR